MNVKLIAHTMLSSEFAQELSEISYTNDRAAVALTAIRTCYSPGKPSEVVAKEGAKYFGQDAQDGEGGAESDRLFRHIIRSGHTSTLEHITYTFAVESVSRALLAQLTRHRVGFSFSVQSQRYVKFGSGDKSGGFDYVTPETCGPDDNPNADVVYGAFMTEAQRAYDELRSLGVPAEDARMVLPNAAACNLVLTVNLRALIDFYGKRKAGRGAQWEIAELAENLRQEVVKVDAWTERYFEEA